MESKWTPGPWTVEDVGECIREDALMVESEYGLVAEVLGAKGDAESAANAALIASAPALAAENERLRSALAGLVEQLDGIGIPEWHGAEGLDMDAARRALSLPAKGGGE